MKSIFIKLKALGLALLSAAILAGCSVSGYQIEYDDMQFLIEQPTPQTTTGVTGIETGKLDMSCAKIDDEDMYRDWRSDSFTNITFNNSSIAVSGAGAAAAGGTLIICSEGTYVLSGVIGDGLILIDAGDEDDVVLILNDVEITSAGGAPLYVKNADKVTLSMPSGTVNTFTDAANYTYEYYNANANEPNATIFSKDDIIINGEGKLIINANFNDGIASNDDIKLISGFIAINAADDGIIGKDMVAVADGTFEIISGGDAIKATNDADAAKGFIAIVGGSFYITAGNDGLQAHTYIYIEDGKFSFITGGTSAISSSNYKSGWGNWGAPPGAESQSEAGQSAKAIKAVSEICIKGGTFVIDSSDDSIHSNKDILIYNGNFQIASGDDGIHADTSINIFGGTIVISKSYEGIESASVKIEAGDISIVSSDDGINIAGGNDSSSVNGRPGQNKFNAVSGGSLNICGGSLVVNALGDGFDSNNAIYISGGTVILSGPTNAANSVIDFNTVLEVTGGTLIGAGSAGMAQNPSAGTSVYTIAGIFDSIQAADSTLTLTDSSGTILLSFNPPKNYQHVVFCTALIKQGETYEINIDGLATLSVTASQVITTFGNAGSFFGGGPGGGQGPGSGQGTGAGGGLPERPKA